ncbi:hypothetical protein bAD24_III10380 [Burkholderia sp. AD24]|nr:hypothetical protein bAD24_III10380 [Burkholderia sp. AD24]
MGISVELWKFEKAGAGTEAAEVIAHIDELCTSLFDLWCERRSLIPLAFLMHSWPILAVDPFVFRRLSDTLDELVKFHRDSLTGIECKLACEVLATASDAADLLRQTERVGACRVA